MVNVSAAAPASAGVDPRRWQALALVCVAFFMTVLDISIVNVALPAIKTGLHAQENQLEWIVSGYALAFGLLLVPAGATPEQIRRRTAPSHRVVLALMEQDDASRVAAAAMRLAFTAPEWREVARGPYLEVYERVGDE